MYYFIINPNSKSGQGRHIWNTIEKILIRKNVSYKAYLTRAAYDALQIANQITLEQERCTIVIVGGDGTVNEVLSGISDYQKITLGFIPAGSSNDLAKGLHLETDPIKALKAIINPKHYHYMDVGVIQYDHCHKNFGVSAGIGFDAAVCHQVLHSRLKSVLNKFHLGKLTYMAIGLKQLMKRKKSGGTLILDHARKIPFETFLFITVMNHPYEGGGFQFCPLANDSDGYLDICVAGNLSLFKCLYLLPFAFLGRHTRFKQIETYRAKHVEIIADSPLPVHCDGESCGFQKSLSMSIEPKQIRLIT